MALNQKTAPTAEPVSIVAAKKHLRYEEDDENDNIHWLIKAARGEVEKGSARQLMESTFELKLDGFPFEIDSPDFDSAGNIRLPKPPLQSVTSIKYTDTAGAEQTWAAANYTVDAVSEPGRIALAYGKSWPSTQGVIDAVTIEYVCGYDHDYEVPAAARQAILLLVGHWFENREAIISGTIVAQVPMAVDRLIHQIKVPVIT